MLESDPNGLDPHLPGAKLDSGKPRVAFAFAQFFTSLVEVNKIAEFGRDKYTKNGWRDVPDGENRYMEALLRHAYKHIDGEMYDKDSGLLHVAHMAWNALAVVYFVCKNLSSQLIQKEKDNEISNGEQQLARGIEPFNITRSIIKRRSEAQKTITD